MQKVYTYLSLILLFAFTMSTGMISAQSPEMMTYQAVVRNNSDLLVINQQVGIQISILETSPEGSPVFVESHLVSTNANGLLSLEIGNGSVISGEFATIDWSEGPYFIKTETDLGGGTNYSITGTSQLMSVPYALFAKTAMSLSEEIIETDPVFASSLAYGITESDTSNWNNKISMEKDSSITNEIQTLSLSNDTIFLSDGGMVVVPFGPVLAEENDLVSFDGTNWVAKRALIGNTGGNQIQNNMQPWLGVNYIIALQGVYPSRSSADPFLAEIIMFGGNFAPRGWAYCDGQLLAISQNSAVFSLLGTTFGGDGRTTFALPDLRGRTPIHPGTGPGLTNRRLGQKGGSEYNIMNVTQMPAHSHTITYE